AGLLLGGVLVACPRQAIKEQPPLADPVAITDRDLRASVIAELQDEVLTSYERDEPPDVESSVIPAQVGQARIGVGPGDLLISGELERAPSRWPLDVPTSTPTEARSKRLEIHLAQDGTAAWVADEVSWRIAMCGRSAVIPLRLTALYARDGDRWVPVFEHLSFGRTPAPTRDGTLRGRTMRDARIDADLHDELSRVLAPVLTRSIASKPEVVATGPDGMIIGPDLADEWQGPNILRARVAAGNLRAEDRRVSIVGRRIATATIAYWVGNFVADLPARPGVAAGKVRFRGTFVFEKRRSQKLDPSNKDANRQAPRTCETDTADCRWTIVQGHVSQPIDDGPDPDPLHREYVDLASMVFGTALISAKPLELTCDDGSRPTVLAPAGVDLARPTPTPLSK
ncbi:MAG: hypothetical protein H0X17_19410, partial [Deltaproteobacteria bacterium]|nr:hypothetical protein [Deltaproteobacteria bacterium]